MTGVMKEDVMTDKDPNAHSLRDSDRHGDDRSYEGKRHDR